MEQIDSIPGKLFYVVYQMFRDQIIDCRGKIILKDLIITNNCDVTAAYEDYVKFGTQLTLRGDLFKILTKQRQIQTTERSSDQSKRNSNRFKNRISVIIPKSRNIQKVSKQIRQT